MNSCIKHIVGGIQYSIKNKFKRSMTFFCVMGLRYLLQTKGLADVLLRRHSASIDAELSTQDLESFTALDTELREENMNVSLNVMTFTSY